MVKTQRTCALIRRLAVASVLGWSVLTGAPAQAVEPERVTFTSAAFPYSELRVRLAEQQGLTLPERGTTLTGWLYQPPSVGKAPAVVLMHGCDGVRQFHHAWARQLTNWGYVALLVDSFAARGQTDVCPRMLDWEARPEVGGRALDAFGARDFLARRSNVDPDRIAVMGWAFDAVLNAVLTDGYPKYFEARFAAAVAFYPNCLYTTHSPVTAPLLMLTGDADDWTIAETCVRMAGPADGAAVPGEAAPGEAAPVRVHVCPDAYHGFDDPENATRTYLPDVWNPNRTPTRGGTVAYNEAAHIDAIKRVQGFLDRRLKLTVRRDPIPGAGAGTGYGGGASADWVTRGTGTWIVDPSEPGPDRPPRGRSLFDFVFSTVQDGAAIYDVPFPFTRIIARLEQHAAPDPRGLPTVKQVLIPLGRSLQREAGAPEFFRYPRVVLGIDTEARGKRAAGAILLKDRFYVGYHEKAQTLEVISYNEAAGRFEFQVVADYGPGLTPRVAYANRRVCTSCHQNQGPIFPVANWLEMNSNFRLARLLADEGKDFLGLYGQTALAPVTGAFSLDSAADRANLLQQSNRLWADSCAGDGRDTERRCRAAAFLAMLQYRLSGTNGIDTASPRYRDDYERVVRATWQGRWPGGLFVADADLPDRDPTAGQLAITPDLDPLTRRPPRSVLLPQRPQDLAYMVFGHAQTFTEEQLNTLDRRLVERALAAAANTRVTQGQCAMARLAARGEPFPLRFRCRLPWADGQTLDMAGGLADGSQADGSRADGGPARGGRIDRLTIGADGQAASVSYVRLALGDARVGPSGRTLTPRQRDSGRHVLLPDGTVLARLEFDIAATRAGRAIEPAATVRLVSAPTLAPVEAVLDGWLSSPAVATPLDGDVFHGHRAVARLLEELGLAARTWCCGAPYPLPDLVTLEDSALPPLTRSDASGLVGALGRHCASCHRTASPSPPNFLQGSPTEIEAQLRICAPRIAYRLGMWSIAEADRAKLPMPPLPALDAASLGEREWTASADYRALQRYVDGLLAVAGAPSGGALIASTSDYGDLPACLSHQAAAD